MSTALREIQIQIVFHKISSTIIYLFLIYLFINILFYFFLKVELQNQTF